MSEKKKKSDSAKVLRVVLADDHKIVRHGIAAMLRTIEQLTIVGEANNGQELLTLVDQLLPDLVVTDISMPKMSGIEALKQIKLSHPDMPVLMLSMHDGLEVVKVAMTSGAAGYVTKDSSRDHLVRAIESVIDTGAYWPPALKASLRERAKRGTPGEVLTMRQIEILQMIAKGMASKEIAFELGLSSKTIDVHRGRIMERTGCRDVASLTRYAMRAGLLDS